MTEDKQLPNRAADDMLRADLPLSSAVMYEGVNVKHVFVHLLRRKMFFHSERIYLLKSCKIGYFLFKSLIPVHF